MTKEVWTDTKVSEDIISCTIEWRNDMNNLFTPIILLCKFSMYYGFKNEEYIVKPQTY
jgi:hypothetical protein